MKYNFENTVIDLKKVVSKTIYEPCRSRGRKSPSGSKVGSFPAINLDLGQKCFIQFWRDGVVSCTANVLETPFYVFVVWFDNCGVISGRGATSHRCIFFSSFERNVTKCVYVYITCIHIHCVIIASTNSALMIRTLGIYTET